jgi:hypothetical protein
VFFAFTVTVQTRFTVAVVEISKSGTFELSSAWSNTVSHEKFRLFALNENENCGQFDVDFGGVQKLI